MSYKRTTFNLSLIAEQSKLDNKPQKHQVPFKLNEGETAEELLVLKKLKPNNFAGAWNGPDWR